DEPSQYTGQPVPDPADSPAFLAFLAYTKAPLFSPAGSSATRKLPGVKSLIEVNPPALVTFTPCDAPGVLNAIPLTDPPPEITDCDPLLSSRIKLTAADGPANEDRLNVNPLEEYITICTL
ncbi:hypothetical protein, partial [Serratia bockelmannii]|uniref:hypothetical protein n=1 Tax=Serratia bockelmannii TaxID=2703793 RepID=UPI00236028D0